MNHSVLIDCRFIMKKPDGIGRYLSELVPKMVDLAPDLDFHLLSAPSPWPGYAVDTLDRPNVKHHTSGIKQMSLRQHLSIPRLARKIGADVIHYPHYDAPVDLAPAPMVVTVHDLKYLENPEWYRGNHKLKNLYATRAYSQTVKKAAAIIAVSRYTADQLCLRFPQASTKTSVVYEAVADDFLPKPGTTIARHRFGIDGPFILTVGERRPHKNQAGLIEAYADSSARNTHALVIVGNPYAGFDLPEQAAKRCGVEDRVHFVGKLTDADLLSIYCEAALFVLVSKYEGFGLPILEAMAAGTPVIASKTTATGEIAGDGAITVDPQDPSAIAASIDMLAGDERARASQAEKGKARVRDFSWTMAARGTLDVYRRILAERARPQRSGSADARERTHSYRP